MTQDEYDAYMNRHWSEYDEKSAELVKAERQARESGHETADLLMLRAKVEAIKFGCQEREQRYREGHYRQGYPSDYAEEMGHSESHPD